jgi:hypothetical protein
MKSSIKLASVVALLISPSYLILPLVPPAQSADISTFIGDVAGLTDIDAKQLQFARRIEDAVVAGRLSSSQAYEYRKQLDNLADLEATYKASDGKLSLWENLKLTFEIDRISKNFELQLQDRQVATSDFDFRQKELLQRIEEGENSGRLTPQEYAELKFEYDRIEAKKQQFVKAYGGMTDTNALTIAMDLDRLSSRIERLMHYRQAVLPRVDVRQVELEKMLSEGISSGKLTEDEAKVLRQEFDRIANQEKLLKASGRQLTSEETLGIALDLEKLSGQIQSKLNDKDTFSTNIALKITDLDKQISNALIKGQLNSFAAQQYNVELNQIQQRYSVLKGDSNNLNSFAAQTLLIDLERLKGKIDRNLALANTSWSGIDSLQSEISKQINDAVSSGRLSDESSKQLKVQLDQIIQQKNSLISARGFLSGNESVNIVASLERLRSDVISLLSDRDVTIPDAFLFKLKDRVGKQLASAITSGKLSTTQSIILIDEYERLITLEADMTVGQISLNPRSILTLATDWEKLATKIEVESRIVSQSSISLADQLSSLEKKILTASSLGQLSPLQTQLLKTEMEKSKTPIVDSQISVNPSLALKVAKDLRSLNDKVDRQLLKANISFSNIDKRQFELQLRIKEGLLSGRLNSQDADMLSKEFGKIAELEAKYRLLGGLSVGEHASLSLELEKLSHNIEQHMMRTAAQLPDVDLRQAQIDQRLAEALFADKLNVSQIAQYKTKLDQISRTEAGYRYSGGGLSYGEALSLCNELDKLTNEIDNALTGTKTIANSIDLRLTNATDKINNYLAAKKLSNENAQKLHFELKRIDQAKSAFLSSGSGLNLAEAESLISDLERLDNDIDIKSGIANAALKDINVRQATLDRMLVKASARGQIKPDQARKLRTELNNFSHAKANFQKKDNNLNYWEIISLSQALDRLDRMVRKQISN